MANDMQPYIGAELQALPLDFIMAAPLIAAVKAQAAAAEAVRGYIESMTDDKGVPKNVQLQVAIKQSDGSCKDVQISAPLISLVPVPHLRIDALTVHFKFVVLLLLCCCWVVVLVLGLVLG